MAQYNIIQTIKKLRLIQQPATLENIALVSGFPKADVALSISRNMRHLSVDTDMLGQTIYGLGHQSSKYANAWSNGKAMKLINRVPDWNIEYPILVFTGGLNTPTGELDWSTSTNLNIADGMVSALGTYNYEVNAAADSSDLIEYNLPGNMLYPDERPFINVSFSNTSKVDNTKLYAVLDIVYNWGFYLEGFAHVDESYWTTATPQSII